MPDPSTPVPTPEPIVLDKEELNKLFETHTNQGDVIVELHRMVYPNGLWDQLKKLNGFPVCSKATTLWLFDKFIAFDNKHHPGVMPGGAWMNHGFSNVGGEELPLFAVIPAPYELNAVDESVSREFAHANA